MGRQPWLDDPVIEDDFAWLLHMGDGSTYVDSDVSVTESDYRRMWDGYVCPWCYQLLESAFARTCKDWCLGGPDVTPEGWRAYMAERFGGEKWIGPSRALWESLNRPVETPRPARSRLWVPGDS